MEKEGLSEQDAFARLRKASQVSGRPLKVVAEAVVATFVERVTLTHLERPARGEPEGLLVLLHGRGADEHDLFPLLDVLDPERRLLGVTPRGPLSLPPGGAHWYALLPARLSRARRRSTPTYPRLVEWLDGLGFPPERTVIGGFSQGGVMAYALGARRGAAAPGGG